MPPNDEIGRAKIIVEADASGVKSSLEGAKKAVKDVGDAADKSGKQAKDAFERAGESVNNTTKGVRGLSSALGGAVGAASAVAGAFVAVVNIIKEVNKQLESGEKIAARFTSQLDTVNDTEASFDKLQERLIQVNAELEAVNRNPLNPFGRYKKQIEQEAEAIRSTLNGVSRQIREQRKEEVALAESSAKEAAEAFKKQFDLQSELQEINILPDGEKIRATADFLRKSLEDAAAEVGLDSDDETIARRLRIIDEEESRKLAALEKRLQIERAAADERNAQQIAAAEQAAEAFASKFDQVFGADFTTRLDTIAAAINRNTSGLGRLK